MSTSSQNIRWAPITRWMEIPITPLPSVHATVYITAVIGINQSKDSHLLFLIMPFKPWRTIYGNIGNGIESDIACWQH